MVVHHADKRMLLKFPTLLGPYSRKPNHSPCVADVLDVFGSLWNRTVISFLGARFSKGCMKFALENSKETLKSEVELMSLPFHTDEPPVGASEDASASVYVIYDLVRYVNLWLQIEDPEPVFLFEQDVLRLDACSHTETVGSAFVSAFQAKFAVCPFVKLFSFFSESDRNGQLEQVSASTRLGSLDSMNFVVKNASDLTAFERLIDLVPDVYACCGVSGTPPTVSKSLDDLIKEASFSPLGKGNVTVVDANARKSLELTKVAVEWSGLDETLDFCSKKLVQGRRLRGEFYKLLIYRVDDYFLYHYDSKKGDNHLCTLVVDLGLAESSGGALCFRSGSMERFNEDHSSDDPNGFVWSSSGAGSFCCFFATQQHCVKPIVSGTRVRQKKKRNFFCCEQESRLLQRTMCSAMTRFLES